MHMLTLLGQGLWPVLWIGILLGAGLPALFALGIRFAAAGAGGDAELDHAAPKPAMTALGWLCFALVALAIVTGIAIIVSSGFGAKLDFGQFPPQFVSKH